jgi:hypothetical protein
MPPSIAKSLSRDPRGAVRHEERNELGDLGRLTRAAERDPAHLGDHRLLGGLHVHALGRGDHVQRSLHGRGHRHPGRDRVDPHPVRRQVERERLRVVRISSRSSLAVARSPGFVDGSSRLY